MTSIVESVSASYGLRSLLVVIAFAIGASEPPSTSARESMSRDDRRCTGGAHAIVHDGRTVGCQR